MSAADPWVPPEGWWIMIREWGSALRLPGRPAPSRKAPIDAARGVDVDVDVLLGAVGLEEQQLGDDYVGHIIVDGHAQEDDPVHEEPREDVVGAFPTARPLDDVRR